MTREMLLSPEELENSWSLRSGEGKLNIRGSARGIQLISRSPDLLSRIPTHVLETKRNLLPPNRLILVEDEDMLEVTSSGDGSTTLVYGDERLASGAEQGKYLQRDLIWVALPLLEQSRQAGDQYLVHGSAVDIEGKGVLFIGPTHSGKTSLAATLGFEYGYNIIATEHALLGPQGIEGGTHIMELYRGLKNYIPHIPVDPPEGDGWDKPSRTEIDLVACNKHSKGAPLSKIVWVQVVHESKEITHTTWSPRKSKVMLSEAMSWMINSSQSFVHDFANKLPPLDFNPEIRTRRIGQINQWVDEQGIRIDFIKGNADAIAARVLELL